MAQVAATVALSVGVRCGPIEAAVNGTVVARPTRTTFGRPAASGISSTVAQGPSPADASLVGKPPFGGAAALDSTHSLAR
jgi:hypothetical protein